MVLRMARSMKRSGSASNQFTRRRPADLKARFAGRTFPFRLPSGNLDQPDIIVRAKAGEHISFSLQTADVSLAKLGDASAAAQVEALLKAERRDRSTFRSDAMACSMMMAARLTPDR